MEFLGICIGSGGLLGVIGLFFFCGKWFGKIEERFKNIDERFTFFDEKFTFFDEKFQLNFKSIYERFYVMDSRLESLMKEIVAIRSDIGEIKSQMKAMSERIARLEAQDEERFRNELRLIVRERHE